MSHPPVLCLDRASRRHGSVGACRNRLCCTMSGRGGCFVAASGAGWAVGAGRAFVAEARAQGGGTAPVDERAVFTAVVFVLTSGCAWRMLLPSLGVTVPTAHRRLTAWTEAGRWRRLHRAVLDELGSEGLIDWPRAVIDAASVRAKKGAA